MQARLENYWSHFIIGLRRDLVRLFDRRPEFCSWNSPNRPGGVDCLPDFVIDMTMDESGMSVEMLDADSGKKSSDGHSWSEILTP